MFTNIKRMGDSAVKSPCCRRVLNMWPFDTDLLRYLPNWIWPFSWRRSFRPRKEILVEVVFLTFLFLRRDSRCDFYPPWQHNWCSSSGPRQQKQITASLFSVLHGITKPANNLLAFYNWHHSISWLSKGLTGLFVQWFGVPVDDVCFHLSRIAVVLRDEFWYIANAEHGQTLFFPAPYIVF